MEVLRSRAAALNLGRMEQLARWCRWPWHRILWRLLLSGGLAIVFAMLMLRSTAEDPQINIVETRKTLKALEPNLVTESENAAVDYKLAFAVFRPLKKVVPIPPDNRSVDPTAMLNVNSSELLQPPVLAYIAANSGVYPHLEVAAKKVQCDWKADYTDIGSIMTPFGDLRHSVRLLVLRARSRAHNGDHAGAAQDLRTVGAIAAHIRAAPFGINAMVSNAMQSIARSGLQAIVMFDAPRRAEDIEAYRSSLGPTTGQFSDLAQVFKGEQAWCMYAADAEALGLLPLLPLNENYRISYGGERKAALGILRDLQSSIEKHEQPPSVADLLKRNAKGITFFSRDLALGLSSIYMTVIKNYEANQNADAALAILLFREKNGRDPRGIDELTPEFLPGPTESLAGSKLQIRITTKLPDRLKYTGASLRISTNEAGDEKDDGAFFIPRVEGK